MIPDDFHDFFLAAASASGALVGLLFVAISVAEKPAVGAAASVSHQIRASSALTALATPLSMSLIALIPGVNLGWPAIIVGFSGTVFVAAAARRLLGTRDARQAPIRSLSLLLGFLLVMLVNLWNGIELVRTPHSTRALDWIAASLIGSLGVGIGRAWGLVGARQSGLVTSLTDLFGRQPGAPDDRSSPLEGKGEL